MMIGAEAMLREDVVRNRQNTEVRQLYEIVEHTSLSGGLESSILALLIK